MSITPHTSAGLRVLRDLLGLTGEQLGAILGVEDRTVRRWEAGTTTIPAGVVAELIQLAERTDSEIQRLVIQTASHQPLTVYRTDDDYRRDTGSCMPASWHRAVVARAAALIEHPTEIQYLRVDDAAGYAEGSGRNRDNMNEIDQSSWPAHLRDDAPSQRCGRCGRYTWSVEEFDREDRMTQPDGLPCGGVFRPMSGHPVGTELEIAEQIVTIIRAAKGHWVTYDDLKRRLASRMRPERETETEEWVPFGTDDARGSAWQGKPTGELDWEPLVRALGRALGMASIEESYPNGQRAFRDYEECPQ